MKMSYLDLNNTESLDLWNSFTKNSSQGSVFSETWYLNALGIDYKILCVIDNADNILSGIVLAKNQINTYSNPMLDKYLGVILKGEGALSHKVISKQYKVIELLSKELKKYKSFDYYFHPEFKNWIPFYWNGFAQQTRYTYRVNLSIEIQEIQSRFHGNLKNDIRNAIKSNIQISKNLEYDVFYNIINKTFLRQGSKAPFNKVDLLSFIKELTLKNRFVLFGAVNQDGETIAVCGLVYDEKSSYLLLNGIDNDKLVRGANALIILEAIKYFHGKSRYFDFEGSMLPGVEQFYRRFGGELVPYYRIWNDNLFNYMKTLAKKTYKKLRYGR